MSSSDKSNVWYLLPLTEFEAGFDSVGFQRWFSSVWQWCFVLSAAYVLLVFGGRRLMRDREPFRLQLPLMMWNVGLAVFSVLGTGWLLWVWIDNISQRGFLTSVCDWQVMTRPMTAFWISAFVFSKVVEFGDTALLILRNKPLTFLHVYHHATVCVYSWFTYAHHLAPAGFFACLNSFIHSVMYTYYAIRAADYRPPKMLSICITTLQILQMIAILVITVAAHLTLRSGHPCSWSHLGTVVTLPLFGSYLLLFLNFFRISYLPSVKKD